MRTLTLVAVLSALGCGGYVPPPDPGPGPNCSTSSVSSSGTCSCDGSKTDRNYVECSETTVQGGICCATTDFPNSGTSCKCINFRCKLAAAPLKCQCEAGASASSFPLSSCTGTVCCQSTSSSQSCRCGDAITCTSSEKAVSGCAGFNLVCPVESSSLSIPVSSCSIPR